MSDFESNIFNQPSFNNNQIQPEQIQQQMDINFHKYQIYNQLNNNKGSNLFQMPQKQFNQNNNFDVKETNNMDMNNLNMDNIFNFHLNKDNQSENIDNTNNINNFKNINLNMDNNFNINPQNQPNEEHKNKNKIKNKNKNKNNQKNPMSNHISQNLLDNPPEPEKKKLENKFSFLYRIDDNTKHQAQKQILAKEKYEVQVKKIAEFDTIEDFWAIFQHLRKPDGFRPGIEYFMFKEQIKPLWEDENNKNGGRFTIKLKRGYTTIIWEEMIFALIGGILPKEIKDEINGIVVTSKKEFNTLQIWFKTFDSKIVSEIEKTLRDLLVIPEEVKLETKQFNINVNNTNNNNNNNTNINSNNKKEYGNYNKKNKNNKSEGFREKNYYNNNKNNYYYGDEGYGDYNNKDYKKNKYQSRKNKK